MREEQVILAVKDLIEPKLKWTVGDLNLVRNVVIDEETNTLRLTINLITGDEAEKALFRKQAEACLAPLGFKRITLNLEKIDVARHGIANVGKIIVVSSGKGGVGKSTVAVNIAASLAKKGYRTGLMDADIYGPSAPFLLGTDERPQVLDDEVLNPVTAHGISSISIGLLVPRETALSWRGQLVSGTILQFIRKVNWGRLDYLIIDMPPGTGDIQLTLAHELKVTGVVVVTIPQNVVIGDVLRSITLYKEKETPIIGVVENMVSYCCEECGHVQSIFSGAKDAYGGADIITSLPLDRDLWESSDKGVPYVLTKSGTPITRAFDAIVKKLEAL